jgi:hypothetical protein
MHASADVRHDWPRGDREKPEHNRAAGRCLPPGKQPSRADSRDVGGSVSGSVMTRVGVGTVLPGMQAEVARGQIGLGLTGWCLVDGSAVVEMRGPEVAGGGDPEAPHDRLEAGAADVLVGEQAAHGVGDRGEGLSGG